MGRNEYRGKYVGLLFAGLAMGFFLGVLFLYVVFTPEEIRGNFDVERIILSEEERQIGLIIGIAHRNNDISFVVDRNVYVLSEHEKKEMAIMLLGKADPELKYLTLSDVELEDFVNIIEVVVVNEEMEEVVEVFEAVGFRGASGDGIKVFVKLRRSLGEYYSAVFPMEFSER